MKILFAASEVFPFAKSGGLADVAGSLPVALKKLGHDVRVILPRYRSADHAGIPLHETGVRIQVRVGDRMVQAGLLLSTLPSDVPVYLVRYDPYFDRDSLYGTDEGDYPDNSFRFIFFSRAVLESMKALGFFPDVLHLNDWQTGLAAFLLHSGKAGSPFARVSTLFTIHNLGYQGVFWRHDLPFTGLGWESFTPDGIEFFGKINFLKAGLVGADLLTTVSRKYAEEIQTPEFGFGLDGVLRKRSRDLFGILNGVDYSLWNPETDRLLPARYSAEDLEGKKECKKALLETFGLKARLGRPLFGCVSRLTDQKGFDLITEIAREWAERDLALVVLGSGDRKYQDRLTRLSVEFPENIGVRIAYDDRLAHWIEAGSDFFLMPSRYEPCGLNQMYSLRYGTIPIVRATGGLDDTITEFCGTTLRGNGFKFSGASPSQLLETIERALSVYRDDGLFPKLIGNAMACDFSWIRSAREYEKLYQILKKPAERIHGTRTRTL